MWVVTTVVSIHYTIYVGNEKIDGPCMYLKYTGRRLKEYAGYLSG